MRKNSYFITVLMMSGALLVVSAGCSSQPKAVEAAETAKTLFADEEAIEYLKEWIMEKDDKCDVDGAGTYHQPLRHWEVEERTSVGIIVLSLELSKSRGNNPNAKEDKDHFRPASKREQRYLIDATENKITRINEKYYQNTNNSFDEPSWRLRTVYSKFKC